MRTLRTLGCVGGLLLLGLILGQVFVDPDVNVVWHGIVGIFAAVFLGCAVWLAVAAVRSDHDRAHRR